MIVLDWLTSHFSNRAKALLLYNRGLRKAKKHDYQGAMDDYTTTIGMPDTPVDVKAMVLYNRALAHVATGEDRKGVVDLFAVLAMDEAFVMINVKTMAKQELARMDFQFSKRNV